MDNKCKWCAKWVYGQCEGDYDNCTGFCNVSIQCD